MAAAFFLKMPSYYHRILVIFTATFCTEGDDETNNSVYLYLSSNAEDVCSFFKTCVDLS